MICMCFDLSSSCIGVSFALFKGERLAFVRTLAVIPDKPNGYDAGYTTQNPKVIEHNGIRFRSYLKPGEISISKTEGEKRVAEFKNMKHRLLLKNIGKQCGQLMNMVKPDVIALEKNKSFNGILTTKLLAEIAGGIYFYAGMRDIPLYDVDESVVRSFIRKTIPDYSLYGDDADKIAIDVKWEIHCRLKKFFESEYPGLLDFKNMTMDESDALAVFYYLLKSEKLKIPKG